MNADSILFISHDLGVVAEIADEVAVMFRGKIVEQAPVAELFEHPKHPYTKGLLACRPKLNSTFQRLPTVSDFMEVKTEPRGDIRILEKSVDVAELTGNGVSGRRRLLHPESQLAASGRSSTNRAMDGSVQYVADGTAPLLSVAGLKVYFPIRTGLLRRTTGHVKAVDGISFDVYRGQTLGLVGESGCGKTTAARAILRLIEPTAGTIRFDGMRLTEQHGESMSPFAAPDSDHLSGPLQFAQSADDGRGDADRAHPRAPARRLSEKATGEGRSAARGRRPGSGPLTPLSARILGRPTAAAGNRAGLGRRARIHRLRRIGFRARRLGAGAGPESAEGPAARTSTDIHLHQP